MLILSKVEVLIIMNNRGFTLVELLAVLAILASMSLVVVMGISASLDRRDEKECENQKQLAINAAKIYFYEKNSVQVDVDTLVDGGYLEESKADKIYHKNMRVFYHENPDRYDLWILGQNDVWRALDEGICELSN